ncbi:ABC transporter periplasmic aliphatic sulfonates-binding protein SsuA [Gottschalkia acidurici 9a]|uniref:ABC transporter periplasmic aliphatic sulfonates-binding protein SsuA n=1 Tax=Gottschalkia acidurici (strain ATCC 7906 / DSM 604 / BCRC 14475 / CIP 104303 / KCTC 5404 / NCIMB 10678 / 9a) TaxID=1128398 RepID=K0B0F3_GOTA9|nr:aliphatic sulfonate ABC transporter substrate-binding protein [Gottschalkia acidurici]AFS79518.1 ABC transporter periplasmic aliphatic sulfonates-binding protein SsuA [Gottschalkia acidurici 9a]
MRLRKSLVYTILVILTLALVGCSDESTKTSSDGSKIVRVGFFPNVTHTQALVGKGNGTFQKEIGKEYTIDWKQFNAGPSELEALLAGELDIGYIGPGPAVNGYTVSKGDLQIISGASNAGAVLIVGKDTDIKDIKDLEHKKIAIPQYGNTQDICLRGLLKDNGLKDSARGGTVDVVQAPNPDIKMLLEEGNIDAAFVPEPWGSRLESEIGAKILLDYDETWREGEYSSAVIIARKEFVENHPDLIEKFLKAHIETTEYINKNNDQAKKVINEQLQELIQKPLPKDVLDRAFDRLVITYDPQRESVKEIVDLSYEVGYLRRKPDLTNLFNLDLLNKVLDSKGLKEIK